MSEIATALGRSAEAQKYAGLFDSMSQAYFDVCESCAMFGSCCKLDGSGPETNKTSQTAYIMALALNMAAPPLSQKGGPIPAAKVPAVAANLVVSISAHGNHTTSGIIGATFVFDVLVANGYGDVALEMLLKDDQPSFGYMIAQGATTLWENWQGSLPSGAAGSNNHIMFGGNVGTISYTSLAGLKNAKGSVAWRNISMRPLPEAIDRLGFANASVRTPRGLAAISWQKQGDHSLEVNVTVPAGSTATVALPARLGGSQVVTVAESGLTVWSNGKYTPPPASAGFDGFGTDAAPYDALLFTVGAGRYMFVTA